MFTYAVQTVDRPVAPYTISTTPTSPPVSVHKQNSLLSLGLSGQAVLQLQVHLAELGYLPLSFKPVPNRGHGGTWAWRYPNTPASIRALWKPGVYTVLTEGAVMTFQADNHLAIDGIAGPQVNRQLTADLRSGQVNQHGYAYIQVFQRLPETLTLWWNGKQVLSSLTNTGIPASPTVLGTWPIYLRYDSQTMSGVTPTGQSYRDPGVPWVNYFYGGDAVHGFVRERYGFPQSLGCVELPVSVAARVWQYVQYGTLVTVSPP